MRSTTWLKSSLGKASTQVHQHWRFQDLAEVRRSRSHLLLK
ncbi:hypothetical protein [Argonema antarcticum]|nr:hypothetical protein [Argonema antarcticum]